MELLAKAHTAERPRHSNCGMLSAANGLRSVQGLAAALQLNCAPGATGQSSADAQATFIFLSFLKLKHVLLRDFSAIQPW